ncbi:MAG: hypothetical protein JSS96_13345 [Bacteroidetes bacterium]|nr:hypothetical protein [Bacteroidota bacterium]
MAKKAINRRTKNTKTGRFENKASRKSDVGTMSKISARISYIATEEKSESDNFVKYSKAIKKR